MDRNLVREIIYVIYIAHKCVESNRLVIFLADASNVGVSWCLSVSIPTGLNRIAKSHRLYDSLWKMLMLGNS